MLLIYKLQIQLQKQPLKHIHLHRATKCKKIAVTMEGVERRNVLKVDTEAASLLLLGRKLRFFKTHTAAVCSGAVLRVLHRERDIVAALYT